MKITQFFCYFLKLNAHCAGFYHEPVPWVILISIISVLFKWVFTQSLPYVKHSSTQGIWIYSDKLITFKQSYLSFRCYPITNLPWTAVILITSQARKLKSFDSLLFSIKLWISQNHRLDRSLRNHQGNCFKLSSVEVTLSQSCTN